MLQKFKDPATFSDDSIESFKLCLECNRCLIQTANDIENEANEVWCSFIIKNIHVVNYTNFNILHQYLSTP